MTSELTKPTQTCARCGGKGRQIDQVKFGQEMRDLREAKRIKLSWVAAKLGFSPAYISDLEKGKRAWNPRLISSFKSAVMSTMVDKST